MTFMYNFLEIISKRPGKYGLEQNCARNLLEIQ